MMKRLVYYKCHYCGHQDSIFVYEEGDGRESEYFHRDNLARSNRERHNEMVEKPCQQCKKKGYILDKV